MNTYIENKPHKRIVKHEIFLDFFTNTEFRSVLPNIVILFIASSSDA